MNFVKNIGQALPFYTSIQQPCSCNYGILATTSFLPSFEVQGSVLSNISLIDGSGNLTVINSSSLTFYIDDEGVEFWQFDGNASATEGLYYMTFSLDGITYYSDWIHVIDTNNQEGCQEKKYITLEWSNDCQLDSIHYQTGFTQKLLFEAIEDTPVSLESEDVKENGFGDVAIKFRNLQERRVFEACNITDGQLMAFAAIRSHSSVTLNDNGNLYELKDFSFTSRTQDDCQNIGRFNFVVSKLIATGCCDDNDVTVTDPDDSCNIKPIIVSTSSQLIYCQGEQGVIHLNMPAAAGYNQLILVTESNGNVVDIISSGSSVNTSQYDPAFYNIYVINHDGITGLAIDNNITQINGCFELTNAIAFGIEDCGICPTTASSISASTLTVCVDNCDNEIITVSVTGGEGSLENFLVVDSNGDIISIQSSNQFNFEGAGVGQVSIYHIFYDSTTTGVNVGNNISDIETCFSLSNELIITKESCSTNNDCTAIAGEISTNSETVVCTDGTTGLTDFNLTTGSETNNGFVIINAQGNVVHLSVSGQSSFDFSTLAPGTYAVHQITHDSIGNVTGQVINEIEGCYAYSFISVCIMVVDCSDPCASIASNISTNNNTSICNDLATDIIITSTGGTGDESIFVVVDPSGDVVLISNNSPVTISGLANGNYQIYQIWYETGLVIDTNTNINSLTGCFELSNAISIVVEDCCNITAGTIATNSPMTICDDGTTGITTFTISSGSGTNNQFVVVDSNGNIISFSNGNAFDFGSQAIGVYSLYHISYEDPINGLAVGQPFSDLSGCFALSPVLGDFEVIGCCDVSAGTISATNTTVCDDGSSGMTNITSSAGTGSSNGIAITNTSGIIVGFIGATTISTDLSTLGIGTYNLYQVTSDSSFPNMIGEDINNLNGCFDVSNASVTITVEDCPTCNIVNAGTITTGSITVCDDGSSGSSTIQTTNGTGTNNGILVVGSNNLIWYAFAMGSNTITPDFVNNLLLTNGNYTIYQISSDEIINNSLNGQNATQLGDCYSLSSPVQLSVIDCGTPCNVTAGSITTTNTVTICDDGSSGNVNVDSNSGSGNNNAIVVVDSNNIIELVYISGGVNVSFSSLDIGTYTIYQVSSDDSLNGIVGQNLFNLSICYAVSTSNMTLIVEDCTCNASAGTISTNSPTTVCTDGSTGVTNFNMTNGSESVNRLLIINSSGVIVAYLPNGVSSYDFSSLPVGNYGAYQLTSDTAYPSSIVGQTTAALTGCFDLQYIGFVITVEDCTPVCNVTAGTVSTNSQLTICSDGSDGNTNINTSPGTGTNNGFIIVDSSNDVEEYSTSLSSFDFSTLGVGTYTVYQLTFDNLSNPIGQNINNLNGCYDYSQNSSFQITVENCPPPCTVTAGSITLNSPATVCDDGSTGMTTFNMSNGTGISNRILIVDSNGIVVVYPPNGTDSYDFSILPLGVYTVYQLSFDSLSNPMGSNINNLVGCFDLSSVTIDITVEECAGCPTVTCGMVIPFDEIFVASEIINAGASFVFTPEFTYQGNTYSATLNIDSSNLTTTVINGVTVATNFVDWLNSLNIPDASFTFNRTAQFSTLFGGTSTMPLLDITYCQGEAWQLISDITPIGTPTSQDKSIYTNAGLTALHWNNGTNAQSEDQYRRGIGSSQLQCIN